MEEGRKGRRRQGRKERMKGEREEVQKEKEGRRGGPKSWESTGLSTECLYNHRHSLAVRTSRRLLESYRVCWLAVNTNWGIREEGTSFEK